MIKFNYKTFGNIENQPILFLHGFMGDSNDWDSFAEKFSTKFYCIALDLCGHGNTECDEFQDYTFEKTSQAIISLLDELKIQKTHVIGYSMGGRFGFYLITHYQKYFSKAILESASPGLKSKEEKIEREQKDMMLARRMHMQPFEQFLDDFYNMDIFISMDKSSEKYKSMLKHKSENNIEQLALSLKYAGTGVMPSVWDKLPTIETDTLLITGSLDTKYSQLAKEIKKTNSKISYEIIDQASHNVHFEQEEKFFNIVLKFLT